MEGITSNVKYFSKLGYQSKQDLIIKGRPMPELKDLLQTYSFQTKGLNNFIDSVIYINILFPQKVLIFQP